MLSRLNSTGLCAATALVALAIGTQAPAQDIPIVNAGFEDIPLEDDYFFYYAEGGAPGWDPYDPNGLDLSWNIGDWNIPAACYPDEAPEGNNIGWAWWDPVNFGEFEIGLQQTLEAALEGGKTYTLKVWIGNGQTYYSEVNEWLYDFDGFPGYRVELVAGDTVVAFDQDSVLPAEGTFEEVTVTYTVANDDPLIGAPLTIRLINRSADAGFEVDFDDVRLSASGEGGFEIFADGDCPGRMTIHANGSTPGGRVGFAYSTRTGNWTIPGGPCAGTELGIVNPTVAGFATADGSGHAEISGQVPAGACGRIYVQAVDVGTCAPSNVLAL